MSLWNKLLGSSGKHTQESPQEIQSNIDNGKAMMLDVRGQEERDAGYLRDSIFIPITELKALPKETQVLPNLDKTKIIYCH